MSNIYTEHARLYFRPGVAITSSEIESLLERILDERGSYWVPVWYESSWPSHIDFQYGSGKGAGLYNLEPEDLRFFEEVWVRFANEGADYDEIYEWSPILDETPYEGYPRRRSCLYGFDEVQIVLRKNRQRTLIPEGLPWQTMPGGFRAACAGSYLALNERKDFLTGSRARLNTTERTVGGFATPSTPFHGDRFPTFSTVPEAVKNLVEQGQKSIARVDLLYAGRIVHRSEWGLGREPDEDPDEEEDWRHRTGDHWDNCLDEEFVRLRRQW